MKTKVFFFIIIATILVNCARRGSPSGGLKDENAPILINSIPLHNTLNFNKNEIRIYFDEYIKLKDIEKQLVISPPLKYKPQISPIGIASKRLTIKIKDTLKPNTTYVFNFGESIEDNNEGNVLANFKYVFSTGNQIDSLKIRGTIKDAFNQKTDKFVSILLYEINQNFNDSTIYKEKPTYVANTLDSLGWEITNIKKGTYQLIALKENQNNYIYNSKEDKIAFLDSIISVPNKTNFNLTLFKKTANFEVSNPIEVSKGHLILGFKGDKTNLKIKPLNNLKNLSFFDKNTDTIHFFYKNFKLDSLTLNYTNTNYNIDKTVKLRLKTIDSLLIKPNIKGVLHKRDTLNLTSNNPIINIDKTKFKLTNKDTLAVDFNTQIKNENLKILFNRQPNELYTLEILPNAITDFFNQKNDSILVKFKTKKDIFYGSLTLTVNSEQYPVIVQLLNEKNKKIVQEIYATKPRDFNFENLVPNKYIIRVIKDVNKNKKWDSGNVLLKIQPEKVIYLNKIIVIKENWFLNETFTID